MEQPGAQFPRLATWRWCLLGLTGGVAVAVVCDSIIGQLAIPPAGCHAISSLREAVWLYVNDLLYPSLIGGSVGLVAGAAFGWWVNRCRIMPEERVLR